MSDVVSFTEIEEQHVELIPGRTLMQTGPLYEDAEGIRYDDLYDDDFYDDLDFYLDDDIAHAGTSEADLPPSSGKP